MPSFWTLSIAALAVLSAQATSAQVAGPNRDGFRQSMYDECLRSTGAPSGNATAQRYCTCSADRFMQTFAFEDRMRIAVQIAEKRLDRSTEARLDALALACAKRATQR